MPYIAPTTPVVNPTAPGQELEILPPPPNLADLARQAREAHAATGRAVGEAVQHALAAGHALITAQQQVPPGQWTRWVQRNCNFSIRHAQRYMKLAKAYDADATRVSRDVLGLSLRRAIKRLARTKVTPTPSKRSAAGPPKTTGLDVAAAWDAAPLAERTRAVNNIGLRPLLEAIPPEWLPALERWLDAHRSASVPAPAPRLLTLKAVEVVA